MSEPWVYLENGDALKDWDRRDKIAYNQRNRQHQKRDFYRNTFDFLTDNRIHGDYLEFGCHRARTFRMALTEARKHDLDQMRFLAFDSFEGLPPSEGSAREDWIPGALRTDLDDFMGMIREHNIYEDNVIPVKGFYKDSLSADLAEICRGDNIKAAFIAVDCDLYESAVPVFKFIEPFLQEGTVIYLDDLFAGYKGNPEKGVAKAWGDFCYETSWCFQPHMSVGWWGKSYIAYSTANISALA